MKTRSVLTHPKYVVWLLVHLVLTIVGIAIIAAFESVLIQGLGSGFIAAGITGWVVLAYMIVADETRIRLDIIERLGLVQGFVRRGAAIQEEYRMRLEKVNERIDVLGFGLQSLREDFLRDFPRWKQRAKVRILLLDPSYPDHTHPYASQRDREERSPNDAIADAVHQFLRETANLQDDSFQVRLYTCLPSVNVFRVDNEIFWGPYLVGRTSRNSPTFVVTKGGDLFERFEQHFEEIWDRHSQPPINGAGSH